MERLSGLFGFFLLLGIAFACLDRPESNSLEDRFLGHHPPAHLRAGSAKR